MCIRDRLEGVHGAGPEEVGIVVIGTAGKQLHIERALTLHLLAAGINQAQAGQQRRRLLHAHRVVIESGVVIDVGRAVDQAVVGDDLDALFLRLGEHVGQRGAVDGRDDQGLGTLRQHVLDLRHLRGNVIIGVLEVGLVAQLRQGVRDVLAVRDPPFRGLRGH